MDPLSAAKQVVQILADNGFIAYFAGGWVRDFLLQQPSYDIDIVSSAPSSRIQELFPRTIPVGIAFGIVIVVHEGHHFEVATFRKEEGYVDGRRPTRVCIASPEEDAKRRDFTINGLFWDPIQEILYDFVGGQRDLAAKVIRAIGEPAERFLEDRLRMIRAVRYATRFGFSLSPETEEGIRTYAPTLFPSVAIERVWQEWKKMSHFAHADKGLCELHRLGLLSVIFPDLSSLPTEEVRNRLTPLASLPLSSPPIAKLLLLFPEKDTSFLLNLCDYLKVSKEERELALFLHKTKTLFSLPPSWERQVDDVEWVHWYAHLYAPVALDWMAAHLPFAKRESFFLHHQKQRDSLACFIERIQNKKPLLQASHLEKEGIVPGKQMGSLLKEGEKVSIRLRLSSPEQVIAVLKKSPLWDTPSQNS